MPALVSVKLGPRAACAWCSAGSPSPFLSKDSELDGLSVRPPELKKRLLRGAASPPGQSAGFGRSMERMHTVGAAVPPCRRHRDPGALAE